MLKCAFVIVAIVASVIAEPGILHAPLAAAPVAPLAAITATSNQVIARNHNGIAIAPILAAAVTQLATPSAAPLAAHLHYAASAAIFLVNSQPNCATTKVA